MILIADKNGNTVGGINVNQEALRTNERSILRDRLSLGRYGTSHAGERDYYQILGYPVEPDLEDYRARFERDPMGSRVVEFPCEETWRDTPTVKDGKDKESEDDTDFCNAWSDFAEQMRVYHYCQRVDVLAGIGRFGLLHIGVAGHGDLKSEVQRVTNLGDIIYLQPYSEEAVSVYEWQTNPNNPRYGRPHIYKISVGHMEGTATKFGTRDLLVHWSRCIHVADGLLENEVYGRPRLQRVINLLDDILKVVGGSAEATWKLMRKGFVLDIDPEAKIEAGDVEDLQTQFDEYDHGLRRFMRTRGMTVKDLGSETVDPSGLFDVIVTLISVATRIPKRILLGSERGELASSQDAANWAGYIAYRQLNYAEPVILRPFIDRLLKWGALPQPKAGRYTCVWDALFETSDSEKADIADKWADAAQKAAKAAGHPVITAEEFRGEFTPFPEQLPDELAQARERAAQMPMPPQGQDVLDQVREVLSNHGYSGEQAKEITVAVARVLTEAWQKGNL
jgi:hypothetical protein